MSNFLIIFIPTKSLEILTASGVILALLQFLSFRTVGMRQILFFMLISCFVFIFSLLHQNEVILRYLYTFILILTFINYFKKCDDNQQYNDILLLTYIIFIFVFLEQFIIRGMLHDLYRAGNVAIHANRESGVFLYPGDLGVVAAVIFTYWWYRMSKLKKRIRTSDIIVVFMLLYLVYASQSRMAILHIFISILFFTNLKNLFYIFGLVCIFIITFQYGLIENDYLIRTGDLVLTNGWTLLSEDSPLKRVQELYVVINAILGYDFQEHKFYESGIVSLYFKVGVIGLLVYLFLIFYTCIRVVKFDYKLLGVVSPIILTNFISAPLDRPKLSVFAIWALCFAVSIRTVPLLKGEKK